MADFENLDYLEKGFDPATLTVPRIRSILVAHDIDYPSGAKKPQLIQIFTDEVLPKRRKLLAARAKVRRMSKGIMDADSQDGTQDSNLTEEEEEEEIALPTSKRPARSTRAVSRAKSNESEDLDVPRTRSPTKRSRTPKASTKHARSSDTETGLELGHDIKQSTARKSRRSEPVTTVPTPQIKVEDDDDRVVGNRRESNFTYDNPFQSGSSPIERHTSGERKRKSLGGSKELSRRKSGTRRRTDGRNADDDIHPPTSSSFEISVDKLNGLVDVDENGVVMDEEFTPEAQLELLQEQSLRGSNALRPMRPQRNQRGFSWKGPLWVAGLALVGAYGGYYRQEKVAVGYCGVGREATQVIPSGVSVPYWARVLVEPECEVCPQHAYCSRDLETNCETDFVLKPHPLSLGGIFPLPPTCEPDGEKVRRVKAVADRAVEELRERRAKYECGDLINESGGKVAVEIDAEDLKKEVSQKRRRGMTEAEFDELWAGAIGEVEGREEVIKSGEGKHRLLTSTSLARLPLGCTIKRSFRLALARHRLEIVAVITLIGLYLYVRNSIASRNKANAAVPNLVAITLERLATQASLHAADKEGYPEGWISIGQLRDDVLRDEFSLSRREAVWQKVRKVVEMNANVRASQREGRNGEISRVWEWIGAVGELGSGGERRRKSGRVSWGVYDADEKSSPVSGNDGGPEVVQKKWQDSRPIY